MSVEAERKSATNQTQEGEPPTPLTVNPDEIPSVLRERKRWVVWRYVWNPEKKQKNGSGKKGEWDKPLFNAKTGRKASSTDSATWTTFDKALAAYREGDWAGLGFVPTPEDGLVIIDVDRCRDPETGVIDTKATAIVNDMKSYTEASPSGTGLRIVAFGNKPDRERSKNGPVEIYDGMTADGKPGGRYLTFTGQRIDGAPAKVLRRPKAVARVYYRELNPLSAKVVPKQAAAVPSAAVSPVHLSDEQLINKAKMARNGKKFSRLWSGDCSGSTSHSEADIALCNLLAFWTGGDANRMDRLFRKSGLMRSKWDDKRGGQTYGQQQIAAALEKVKEFYSPEKCEDDADATDAPEGKKSQSQLLVELALASGIELFHDRNRESFVTLPAEQHFATSKLRNKTFKEWLCRLLYAKVGKPPGSQAITDALMVLEGEAIFKGPELPVFLRIAECAGKVYLDLGDESWRAVEIDADGWRIVAQPPVKFRRAKAMLPLPEPAKDGSVADLRSFLNVGKKDWPIVLAWLVAALRPKGPYPVLCFHGEQGSAKSTQARLLRSLVDPNSSPVRVEPREGRDLMIAANNSWIICLDNVSYLPPWLSDAICRLATGGGLTTRTLYTDEEETIFDAQRPVMLNGIEEVTTRSDLLDRALLATCPTIPEERRRTEAEFWDGFEKARPRILGALLDAVAIGLRNLPGVKLDALPRMADFAQWAVACEPALGLKEGKFLQAYRRNARAANETALDVSVIASPLRLLLDKDDGHWSGTASNLLRILTDTAGEQMTRSKEWPKSPHVLSSKIRRLIPNLRKAGVEVEFHHDGKSRTITLRRTEQEKSVSGVKNVSDPRKQGVSRNPESVSRAKGSVSDALGERSKKQGKSTSSNARYAPNASARFSSNGRVQPEPGWNG